MRAIIAGRKLVGVAALVIGSAVFVASGSSVAARHAKSPCCEILYNGTEDHCLFISTTASCHDSEDCTNGQSCCQEFVVCPPIPGG